MTLVGNTECILVTDHRSMKDKLPSMNRRFNAEIEYFWPTPHADFAVLYSTVCTV